MFDAEIYRQRRQQLMRQMESGLLLFLGNEMSPMNYADNHYPFWQDGSFLYYFGLDVPGLNALIDVDEGEAVLYGHDPTLDEIVWTGPQPPLHERVAQAGIEETGSSEDLSARLGEAGRQGRPVHFLPPYRAEHRLRLERLLGLQAARADAHASEKLIRAVVAQRSAKSDEEVAEIERALEVSREMHRLAMQRAQPGATEQAIAGAMEGVALSHGGQVSFPIICSVRGEIFHSEPSGYEVQEDELLLCDAGATSPRRYASDITRTVPVGRRFSERQREIYQVVLDAQKAAIEEARPGVKYKDVHLATARRMTHAMKDLGFMKGNVEEAVAAGAHAIFFPHGLGHMMGLDVHDMEGLGEDFVGYDEETRRSEQFGLNFLRLGRRLEAGFTLTVEPGVYFIPPLIDQWRSEGRHEAFINYDRFEAYKGFGGIRIEDDVLVTEDGGHVLGPSIPKEIDEVEALAAA